MGAFQELDPGHLGFVVDPVLPLDAELPGSGVRVQGAVGDAGAPVVRLRLTRAGADVGPSLATAALAAGTTPWALAAAGVAAGLWTLHRGPQADGHAVGGHPAGALLRFRFTRRDPAPLILALPPGLALATLEVSQPDTTEPCIGWLRGTTRGAHRREYADLVAVAEGCGVPVTDVLAWLGAAPGLSWGPA